MSANHENEILCPCGAVESSTGMRLDYSACCKLLHSGHPARSPEALMRARFSAYTFRIENYLLQSWHPAFRPKQINLAKEIRWCHLHVIHSSDDVSNGEVSFTAIYRLNGQWHRLTENSQFVKLHKEWLYTQGKTQVLTFQPRRNEPCPCGSGIKAKRCCI